MMVSDAERAIVFKSSLIPTMATRSSGGVSLMTLSRREKAIVEATADAEAIGDAKGFRKYKLPAIGVPLADKLQLSFDDNL